MNMKQSCKALICAIEGELDGRHCTEEQAAAILDHALPSLTEAVARAEARLTQAADLLRGVTNQPFINSNLVKAIDLFLAIQAQAEQQEAPGAQAVNEPVGTFKSFEALLKNIEATWFAGADLIRSRDVAQRAEITQLRAALATQPDVRGAEQ